MKKIMKLMALGLGLMSLTQSCDLNREPRDLITFENSFKTLNDAKQWDNGLYVTLRQLFGGEYVMPQEVQADMLNDCGGEYRTLHGWTMRSDGTFFDFYQNYYAVLVDANIIISKIPTITAKNEVEQAELDRYLGNALFARAYYYFNLAIRWGVPYQEATAHLDLCVPLETEPFTEDLKPRSTNEQVYGQILSDLTKAEQLLATVEPSEGNREISSDLVKALRSRVFFYMGKMTEALAEAESLIQSGTYPLIPALAKGETDPQGSENPFIQMWNYDSGKEQIWQPFINKPDELPKGIYLYGADFETAKKKAEEVNNENINRPAYLPTGSVVYDLFAVGQSTDRRIPAYFEPAWMIDNTTGRKVKVYVISKFKGNPRYKDVAHQMWGGYLPNGIQAPKPFRIAEQYLIASEAAYYTGDNAKAQEYLNALRASRGLEAITVKTYELELAIQEERARELAYEGFRLWDLRRWHKGFDGRKRQGVDLPKGYSKDFVIDDEDKSIFFSKNDFTGLTVEANDYRFVWAFPYREITKVNRNIVQNKGW